MSINGTNTVEEKTKKKKKEPISFDGLWEYELGLLLCVCFLCAFVWQEWGGLKNVLG